MKKFISTHAFWVLQIIGCAAFALFASLLIASSAGVYERLIYFNGIFLSYFIPTTILRYLYKRFVRTNSYKPIDFAKIILFITIMVVLGKQLPYYIGYLSAKASIYFGLSGEFQSTYKPPKHWNILQYIGPLMIYSGWTFFYFVIKEFRKYITTNIERSKLKDKIKQAQLNTLKGHLNPKFIVASLQMIKELMLSDVPLARNLLTKLSETLRYSLTKNNINSVTLHEELEIARNYVDLLNISDNDKYQVSYDIDPETYSFEVPPILLMSLMEIATKYGILRLKEGGKVLMSSKQLESGFEIRLSHTGKIAKLKATEVLENTIKQRLRLLFEGKAEFNTKFNFDTTTILVNMPLTES